MPKSFLGPLKKLAGLGRPTSGSLRQKLASVHDRIARHEEAYTKAIVAVESGADLAIKTEAKAALAAARTEADELGRAIADIEASEAADAAKVRKAQEAAHDREVFEAYDRVADIAKRVDINQGEGITLFRELHAAAARAQMVALSNARVRPDLTDLPRHAFEAWPLSLARLQDSAPYVPGTPMAAVMLPGRSELKTVGQEFADFARAIRKLRP